MRYNKVIKEPLEKAFKEVLNISKQLLFSLRKKDKKFLKKALFLGVSGIFVLGGLLILWIATLSLPALNSFENRQVAQSTKIYDRTGETILFDVHQNIKRTIVPFSEISDFLKKATVSIEDEKFYEHRGVDTKAIFRAVFVNISTLGFSQGGSTITQQVIKNALLTPEKTIIRKLKEWFLAIKLEKMLTKEEIFNIYLNEIPYGGDVYGAEQAAQTFFGKKAKDLTLAESAYLASLPKAPSYYSPYGQNRDKLESRKNLVLRKMLEKSLISEDEYNTALNEKVVFGVGGEENLKAPHFVMYMRSYLEEKYGIEMVEKGGLKVTTSLDYDLQKKAEDVVYKRAMENSVSSNAENAGLVAIDPKTGQILVMVGSRSYFDEKIDGNYNVITAHRQPGSSIKPIIYSAAFEKGYTPETVVFDLPTEFSTVCVSGGDCYSPQNYDGKTRGPVSLRSSLAQSLNIPSVKVLYLVGVKEAIDMAKRLGISTLTDPNRYGLTLVLGGGEVTPLELASAYSVFASGGIKHQPVAILKVEDSKGNVLEEFKADPKQVLDSSIAYTISDILSDNIARTPIFGANSSLYFAGRDVAVKTGTTNDFKDAWVMGYTPYITVGVWVGNNDNTPMEKKSSSMIAAPLWREFMLEVFKKYPDEVLPRPSPTDLASLKPVLRGVWQGDLSFTVDKTTGLLATEITPPELKEEKHIYNIHDILYWVNKDNPRGPKPVNPADDPAFGLWEEPVQKWVLENGYLSGSLAL